MSKPILYLFVLILSSSVATLLGLMLLQWVCEDVVKWWYNGGRLKTMQRLALPVSVIERIYDDCSRL